jgi:leucyl-tRNA synthetase
VTQNMPNKNGSKKGSRRTIETNSIFNKKPVNILSQINQIKDLDHFENEHLIRNNVNIALLFILPIPPHLSDMSLSKIGQGGQKKNINKPKKADDSLIFSETHMDVSIMSQTHKNSRFNSINPHNQVPNNSQFGHKVQPQIRQVAGRKKIQSFDVIDKKVKSEIFENLKKQNERTSKFNNDNVHNKVHNLLNVITTP